MLTKYQSEEEEGEEQEGVGKRSGQVLSLSLNFLSASILFHDFTFLGIPSPLAPAPAFHSCTAVLFSDSFPFRRHWTTELHHCLLFSFIMRQGP